MKLPINTLIAASVLAAPVLSIAQQSTSPVTRAQVRAELGQLEAAGFKGASNGPYYPANLQAAEARVERQKSTTGNYGPSTGSSSQSGGQPGASAEAR